MAVTTVRPNNTVATQQLILVSAANAAVALNDNSDGSYISHSFVGGPSSYSLTDLGDLGALASGEQIVRVRARARWKNGFQNVDFHMIVENVSGQQCASDYFTAQTGNSFITYTGAWKLTAPDGGAWTLAKVNALRLRLQDNGGGNTKPEIAEAYVDIETNIAPTTAVSAPSGAQSSTSQPSVTASYSDTEGDPMDAYEIKVFDSVAYSAGGFSPDTSTPTWTSGEVASSVPPSSLQIGVALSNNASYRAYVRVRQAGVIVTQWSSWAFSSFTISITSPATPTVLATTDVVNARNVLSLSDRQNMLTADDASFEVSVGGWTALSGCTISRINYAGAGADGSFALDMLATAAGTMQATSGNTSCIPGQVLSAMGRFYGVSSARQVRVDIKFYTAANALITSVAGVAAPVASVSRSFCIATAPATSAYARVTATVLGIAASGEHYYADTFSLVPGPINQLLTPAFDSDANADGVADNWILYTFGGSDPVPVAALQTLNPFAFFGTKSQQLSWTSNAGWKGVRQVNTMLVSGQQYTLSAWVRSDNGGNINLYITDPTNPVSNTTISADIWTRVTLTFTATSSQMTADVYVRADAAADTLWIGHIQLELGATAGVESMGWTRGGLQSPSRFEVQRSIDGGTTWFKLSRMWSVNNAGLMVMSDLSTIDYSDVLQTQTAYDYEAPRSVTAMYRVRTSAVVSGNTIVSGWSPASLIVTAGSGWWLKSLTNPANSVKPNINANEWTVESTERQGVFRPLGRRGAVVLADAISGDDGVLKLAFLDQASYDAFEALRGRRETLLLQSPYGDNDYIHLGADRSATFPLGFPTTKRAVTVPFFEVDAP